MRKNQTAVIIFAVMGMLWMNGCRSDISDGEKNQVDQAYMKISTEEAKELMDSTENYVLVDVREEDEYEQGHIQGALLMPYGKIGELAANELLDKNQTILLYCRSGRRSAIAAQTLAELGYTDVRDFGGIIDWEYEIVTRQADTPGSD